MTGGCYNDLIMLDSRTWQWMALEVPLIFPPTCAAEQTCCPSKPTRSMKALATTKDVWVFFETGDLALPSKCAQIKVSHGVQRTCTASGLACTQYHGCPAGIRGAASSQTLSHHWLGAKEHTGNGSLRIRFMHIHDVGMLPYKAGHAQLRKPCQPRLIMYSSGHDAHVVAEQHANAGFDPAAWIEERTALMQAAVLVPE